MQDKLRAILVDDVLSKVLSNVILLEDILMSKDDFEEYTIARRIRRIIENLRIVLRTPPTLTQDPQRAAADLV
jgi:hypothetical protein